MHDDLIKRLEAEGFVMVPVEPTAEQLLHGRRWGANCGGIYRAMIAARPKGDAFTVAT